MIHSLMRHNYHLPYQSVPMINQLLYLFLGICLTMFRMTEHPQTRGRSVRFSGHCWGRHPIGCRHWLPRTGGGSADCRPGTRGGSRWGSHWGGSNGSWAAAEMRLGSPRDYVTHTIRKMSPSAPSPSSKHSSGKPYPIAHYVN